MTPTSTKAKKHLGLSGIASLLIATSFASSLLGFLRTRLVNANFPAVGLHSTDAYFAAFNIPDFFFFTLAAGALGVAFMPVLAEHLHRGDKKGIWELSTSLLNLLTIVMAVVGVVIFAFARPLLHHVVAPKLGPTQLNDAVFIMRCLAFNPLLFTISGVLTATQQTFGRFFFYALAPLFYNASIIISIFVFRHNIGLVGLGIGALIGGIVQLVIVCFGLIGTNFKWQPKIMWQNADFRQILRQLPPRSIDQGIDQIESIVETNFATRLGSGNVSFYNNAYILSTAPTLLIGTAISTAAFPQLNNRLAQNRSDLFRKDFLQILRAMIWLTAPVVVVCFFARGYLAHLITSTNNYQIASIFGALTISIFFGTLYTIISRWFYAHKDTITPLLVSVATILLNILLVSILARPAPHGYGVNGLALAQSAVAVFEVVILSLIMLKRDPKLFDLKFLGGVVRIISVTGFSIVAGFIAVTFFPLGANDRGFVTLGSKLALIAGVVFAVHLAASWLFNLEEIRPLLARAKRFIFRPVKVEY